MKRFLPLVFVVPVVAAAVPFARAEPPEWSGNPDKTIVVRTLPGMMRYDTTDIAVPPGARVKLTLENPDDLQHNLVILKPDAKDKDGQKFAQEAWLLGEEGIKLGWVPRDHPRILVAARLLDPKAGEDLYFVAPAEAGDYPFICTVPGHSMLMRGTLHIRSETKLLEDLSYSIYEGNWDKLPDFSKLTAVETGKLPGGLVTLQVAKKRKGGFGIVFEGRLKVTRAEKFEFFLDSDDGSRLIIDGEGTVDRDGVHPDGSPNKGEETLQEGEHGFRLLYFEKSGNRGLSLAAKSKSLGEVALSESVLKKKAARPEPDPILLTPANGEAIVHRAFISGVNPRAIAVGYPGGVNLCWDADAMNLSLIWRGGFLDAAPHWNGRGSGSKVAGYDVAKPAPGSPIQILESLDEPWVPDSTVQVKYERDTVDPQKEITINVKPEGFQFRGYRLDAKRFPTFRYTWREMEIEETFAPGLIDGKRESLTRTIALKGKPEPNAYVRLGEGGNFEPGEGGWRDAGQNLAIKVVGADPVVRRTGGKNELLVALDPAAAATTLIVTYAWKTEVGGRVK